MKYEYKGNIYNYVGVGKFKDSTGKMYIEHFVLLAGAYNLGFFIFYFLFF